MDQAAATSTPPSRPVRVLLVEDDSSTSGLVARALSAFGYACDTTASGEEAVALAGQHAYDILVLDLMLPDIDGFEVLRRLRKPEANIPILILSALAVSDEELKGLGLGTAHYLAKPFNTRELVGRIEAIVRLTEASPGPSPSLGPSPSPGPSPGPSPHPHPSPRLKTVTATLRKEAAPGPEGAEPPAARPAAKAKARGGRVIVLGNEKGGAGKSTMAMHLIVALLREGRSVASIDLDLQQGSLSRYIENRRAYSLKKRLFLPMPNHVTLDHAEEDPAGFAEAVAGLRNAHDYVIVDTPGSSTALSRLAHNLADTIITPLNDSFLDLDVLARLEGETLEFERPGRYGELVAEARTARAARDGHSIDWIVLRNRLSNLSSSNKLRMADALGRLSRHLDFRSVPGLSERVIYRQMFHTGLTLLDLGEKTSGEKLTISRVAARQELRAVVVLIR